MRPNSSMMKLQYQETWDGSWLSHRPLLPSRHSAEAAKTRPRGRVPRRHRSDPQRLRRSVQQRRQRRGGEFRGERNVVLDLTPARARYTWISATPPGRSRRRRPPATTAYTFPTTSSERPTPAPAGLVLLGMGIGDVANSCLWANFTDSLGRSWAIRFAPPNNPGSTWARATRADSFQLDARNDARGCGCTGPGRKEYPGCNGVLLHRLTKLSIHQAVGGACLGAPNTGCV